jgi:hypothetical protein
VYLGEGPRQWKRRLQLLDLRLVLGLWIGTSVPMHAKHKNGDGSVRGKNGCAASPSRAGRPFTHVGKLPYQGDSRASMSRCRHEKAKQRTLGPKSWLLSFSLSLLPPAFHSATISQTSIMLCSFLDASLPSKASVLSLGRTRVHNQSSIVSNKHNQYPLILNEFFGLQILKQCLAGDQKSESTLPGTT